jgi:hypothetical protein
MFHTYPADQREVDVGHDPFTPGWSRADILKIDD